MATFSRTCFCVGLILMLALPGFLAGQSRLSGEITGIVLEAGGEALPGVTVSLTGEKLLQGSMNSVSGAKGLFRFINLNPGFYQLELALSGFERLQMTNVEVRLGQTTSLRIVLKPTTISQEVKVVAQAPLVETKSAQVSTNYPADIIDKLPTGRNMLDLTEAVPGINDRGAYGAGGIQDGNSRAAGTTYYRGSSTSAYLFNGVDISDLNTGATWVSPNYDSIEEIEVVGIGASAEYGNFSGAVVNVVTKKGTNRIRGGVGAYFVSKGLQGDNSKGIIDLRPNDLKYNLDTSASLGGPLIKERLFFFLAGGYSTVQSRRYGDPAYNSLKQPHIQARLDWIPTTKHSLALLVNTDRFRA